MEHHHRLLPTATRPRGCAVRNPVVGVHAAARRSGATRRGARSPQASRDTRAMSVVQR